METSLTSLQHQTLLILFQDTSKKKPISGLNLSKRIGLKEDSVMKGSDIRAIIHAIRKKGFPICASGRGYYYARTQEDLSKYMFQLQSRIMSLEEAYKGLKGSFGNVGFKMLGVTVENGLDLRPTKVVTKKKCCLRRLADGVAVYGDLTIGTDGKPIVPEGYELI